MSSTGAAAGIRNGMGREGEREREREREMDGI